MPERKSPMLLTRKKILRLVKDSMRRWIALCLAAPILFVSCATGQSVSIPSCPPPSMDAVDQFDSIIFSDMTENHGKYSDFIYWISEIERYCSAISKINRG